MKAKPSTPRPPAHLSESTRKWWLGAIGGYTLEPHHVRLLTLAGEAWDRHAQARKVLEKKGLTFNDRFRCPRARPEVAIERDSRLAFARLLRELDLDVSEPAAGRPPALLSNRRTA